MEKNGIIISNFPIRGKFLSPPGFLYPAAQIALEVLFLDRLALVIELFALADGDLHLDETAVVEIDLCRDKEQAPLADMARYLFNLLLMQKELPGPLGVFIQITGLTIRIDVKIIQISLVFKDPGEAVLEIDVPRADGLDLASFELNAAFPPVAEHIIPEHLLVGRDRLCHGGVIITIK